jgi:hypothetical protein
MTEPTLRQPTKKAFFFPTSAEVREEKSPAKGAKAPKAVKATKASKGAAEGSRSKRVNAKEKTMQIEKKAAEAPAEVAVEVEAKSKVKRAKKESARKDSEVKKDVEKKDVEKKEAVKKEAVKKEVDKKEVEKKEAVKKESVKKEGAKKEKVVRDSFTMPKAEYEKIALLKKKCQDAGVTVKKSELLRAGLALLDSTSEQRLLAAIAAVETVKTGRPAKSA